MNATSTYIQKGKTVTNSADRELALKVIRELAEDSGLSASERLRAAELLLKESSIQVSQQFWPNAYLTNQYGGSAPA